MKTAKNGAKTMATVQVTLYIKMDVSLRTKTARMIYSEMMGETHSY